MPTTAQAQMRNGNGNKGHIMRHTKPPDAIAAQPIEAEPMTQPAEREAQRQANGGWLVPSPIPIAEICAKARMLDPVWPETLSKPNEQLALYLSWGDAIYAAGGSEIDIDKWWHAFDPQAASAYSSKTPVRSKYDALRKLAAERESRQPRAGDAEALAKGAAHIKAMHLYAAKQELAYAKADLHALDDFPTVPGGQVDIERQQARQRIDAWEKRIADIKRDGI